MAHFAKDRLLGFDVEIDQHIAQEDDVQRRHPDPFLDQIHLAEIDPLAQVLAEFPLRALPGEILHEQCGGQAAVDFELAVAAGFGAGHGVLAEFRRDVFEVPREQLGEVFGQGHHHTVGLLAGGGRAAPEVELPRLGVAFHDLGEEAFFQGLEGMDVAEERGLVRGHRVHDFAMQIALGFRA